MRRSNNAPEAQITQVQESTFHGKGFGAHEISHFYVSKNYDVKIYR
jgi:hypothetical protein